MTTAQNTALFVTEVIDFLAKIMYNFIVKVNEMAAHPFQDTTVLQLERDGRKVRAPKSKMLVKMSGQRCSRTAQQKIYRLTQPFRKKELEVRLKSCPTTPSGYAGSQYYSDIMLGR